MEKTLENLTILLEKARDLQEPSKNVLEAFIFAPEADFTWEQDEGGDWYPVRCDDEDCGARWHLVCYIENIGRKDGKLWLDVLQGDLDGNWDSWLYWEEGWDKEEVAEFLGNHVRDYFLDWAEYWLDCAETGTDPLEQMLQPYMTPQDFKAFCLEAALKSLEYAV